MSYQVYKAYAVICNPDCPEDVLAQMRNVGLRLDADGWTLRTAGGVGAEEAFEKSTENKEVYIPWRNFNNRDSKLSRNLPQANDVVRPFAPSFDTLKPAVQTIIASKAHTVLGKDLKNPVRFMLTWTLDGCESAANKTAKTGFAGVSIALASSLKIPVFNLKNPNALTRLQQYLEG